MSRWPVPDACMKPGAVYTLISKRQAANTGLCYSCEELIVQNA